LTDCEAHKRGKALARAKVPLGGIRDGPSLDVLAVSADAGRPRIGGRSRYRQRGIIHQLYIAPAKSNNWGENKLQTRKVARTERFTISNLAPGVYDLKVVDDDNHTCVFTDISIDQTKEWQLTDNAMISCVFKSK
jgi:hypothetical protein